MLPQRQNWDVLHEGSLPQHAGLASAQHQVPRHGRSGKEDRLLEVSVDHGLIRFRVVAAFGDFEVT